MAQEDLTTLPGRRLSDTARELLVAELETRFSPGRPKVINWGGGVGPHGPTPLWNRFTVPTKLIEPDALKPLPLAEYRELTIYREYPRPGVANQATWPEILLYFRSRNRWEHIDTYVVPSDLSWCIAYTHEDVQGVDAILVAGSLQTSPK